MFLLVFKINKLLLELMNGDIKLILDNHVEREFSFDWYVRDFHVYKDVWSPLIGEEGLECLYWNVYIKRKTNQTNLLLPCIVMIFLGELLLDMYQ